MTIRSILLAEKLTGLNFTNWYRNLRIVLRYEKKLKFMEQPIGPARDPETADPNTIDKYYESVNLEQEVACLMLSSMSPNLQRTLEKYNAYDMMKEPKTMFEEQAKQELFETVKAFHACKQEEGQSVRSYLFKMESYLDMLERLGYAMPKELGVSLILNSFNKDYDQLVHNYNMHSIGKTLAELHAMLKLHKKGIPKKAETPTMLDIREGRIQKDKKKKPQRLNGKGKNKLSYDPKPKIPPPPKREHLAKDSICHHCKRKQEVETWSFKPVHGQWNACTIEAIRSFDLILPCGLIIVLDNYNFAPTVTRGVVSISCLVNNGYIHTFTNYGISVSKDNVFYFNAIPRDGIYEIDMHNLYPNVSSIYNVSNKRPKHGLDSYYLWHCHLRHINKKRMDMLQRDGLLQPTHDESHEKSARIPQVPDRYGYYVDIEEYELGDLNEPPNYKAALADPKSNKWLEAMNTKMQSMKDKQVWYLVDLPSNGRTVGCKWLFKKKTDMDGNVHTFKAHLVVKGFTQTYGVDYGETFSPVADIIVIRIFFSHSRVL
ncbi:zinc finger, CCHC-type containing protein [Tanacetum coccineum]